MSNLWSSSNSLSGEVRIGSYSFDSGIIKNSEVLCLGSLSANSLVVIAIPNLVATSQKNPIVFTSPTSIAALFGANAIQSAEYLIIKKSDIELTPSDVNTAESLVVGLLLLWVKNTSADVNNGIQVTRWGIMVVNNKIRYQILIELFIPVPLINDVPNYSAASQLITPMNYVL